MKDLTKTKLSPTREKKFEKIIKKYSKLIYSTVVKYCPDPDRYHDAIQWVFTRLHKAFVNKEYNFDDYNVIFTISRNATHEYFRKKEVKTIHLSDKQWNRIGTVVQSSFRISMLKNVLTEEEYEFIYMVYVCKMKIKDYAEMKNIGYGAARYQHKRILKLLEEELEGFVG